MDKREALKNMLNNLINDKTEQAVLDLHDYLTTKMREVSGLSTNDNTTTYIDDSTDDSTGDGSQHDSDDA